MDPRLVEQLLQLITPVALIVLVMNVTSRMTGIGQKLVKRLTEKVVSGILAVIIIYVAIAALCQHFHR